MPSEMIAFFGIFMGFSVVFFVIVMPRMEKMRKDRKAARQEEKFNAQQAKMSIEKERIEQEVMRKKLMAEAEIDIENKKTKFCTYCGGAISPNDLDCDSCGAKLQQ